MKVAGLIVGVGAILCLGGNMVGGVLIVVGLVTMICVEGGKIEDDEFHVM